MGRRAPVARQAADFILTAIREKKFPAGGALPPVEALASMAGVSYVTMWKARRRLLETGILKRTSRKRLIVSRVPDWERTTNTRARDTGEEPREEKRSPSRVWERLRARIHRDLRNGAYSASTSLPSTKQLCAIYATSYATLKKALASLADDGTIVPYYRNYRVPPASPAMSNARIVMLSSGMEGGLFHRARSVDDLISYVRLECQRCGVALDNVLFYERSGKILFERPDARQDWDPKPSADVLGYVIALGRPRDETTRLVSRVCHLAKPVSLADFAGTWTVPTSLALRARVRVCTVAADIQASEEVAAYLLHLGHRRIAFLSPYFAYPWAKERLRALAAAFETAGYPDAVKPFVLEKSSEDYSDRVTRRESVRRIERLLQKETQRMGVGFSRYVTQRNRDAVRRYTAQNEVFALMLDPMRRALRDRDTTAWVCDNDEHAIYALEFLRKQRVAVPKRLSVVGFDDIPRASVRELTTYRFDLTGGARTLIAHILAPAARRKRNADYVHVTGTLVVRGTTGRACPNR